MVLRGGCSLSLAETAIGIRLHRRAAQQSRADLRAWQSFLAAHRVAGIVELGTGLGAFSLWLAERVPLVVTVDAERPSDPPKRFVQRDIFADPLDLAAPEFRGLRPLLLFCDNGDKPREVALYGPALRVGDYLAVHDFDAEIFASDIPSEFKPVLADVCEELGSVTRFFQRL